MDQSHDLYHETNNIRLSPLPMPTHHTRNEHNQVVYSNENHSVYTELFNTEDMGKIQGTKKKK